MKFSAPLSIAAGLLSWWTATAPAQPSALPEVRQLVTFRFLPGQTGEALRIYQQQLRPIYSGIDALVRFRGYGEVESPEPLDLIVVSSYRGMTGMDAANEALRRPPASGPSAFSLYEALSALTATHHDQFVEIIPRASDSVTDAGGLTVFEYLRLAPAADDSFEQRLLPETRAFERTHHLVQWSETGRMLISDGWDYLRIFGIRSLGDWHRYQAALRSAPFRGTWQGRIAARKVIVVRPLPSLSVR